MDLTYLGLYMYVTATNKKRSLKFEREQEGYGRVRKEEWKREMMYLYFKLKNKRNH